MLAGAVAAAVSAVALPIGATAEPAAQKSSSALAENGRIIYRSFNGADNDIRTINVDGTGDSLLVGGSTDDRDATFSPDGKRIAFRRADAADQDILWRRPTAPTPST